MEIKLILNERNINIENRNIWRKICSIAEVHLAQGVMFDSILFDESEMTIFLTTFFKVDVEEENMVFLISEPQLINYTRNYVKFLWVGGEKFSLKNFPA